LIYEVTLSDPYSAATYFGGVIDWYQSQGYREPAVMSSSTVTYTSVYTDSEPGRPVVPPSPDYAPEPGHPLSPYYVPGPEHPPSPVYLPYVPEPEYPEYLAPSNAEVPLEDQSLPVDASPITLSPGYVADSDPDKDPREDPEEDHTDYPADGEDGNDEPPVMMMMMMRRRRSPLRTRMMTRSRRST
ncbi:hypothetical protein Tco_0112879, partial [Tanacetum coccineum]